MMFNRGIQSRSESGVALVMVLWFVAAMSLMVTGIMGEAKLDMRLSQLYLRQAQAEALGDGAIQMAMLNMLEQQRSRQSRPAVMDLHEQYDEVRVHTRIRPASGYINLNYASEKLLGLMFERLGGLDKREAGVLAARVIKWRSRQAERERFDPTLRYGKFEAPEDLLLVEGVNKALYDAVAEAISVTDHWESQVNLLAAPPAVLQVLADADAALIEHWQQAQKEPSPGVLQPPAETDLVNTAATSIYRVEARIRFPDGQVFQRVRWVEYGQAGRDRLPWRFFRTESVARIGSLEFSGT